MRVLMLLCPTPQEIYEGTSEIIRMVHSYLSNLYLYISNVMSFTFSFYKWHRFIYVSPDAYLPITLIGDCF